MMVRSCFFMRRDVLQDHRAGIIGRDLMHQYKIMSCFILGKSLGRVRFWWLKTDPEWWKKNKNLWNILPWPRYEGSLPKMHLTVQKSNSMKVIRNNNPRPHPYLEFPAGRRPGTPRKTLGVVGSGLGGWAAPHAPCLRRTCTYCSSSSAPGCVSLRLTPETHPGGSDRSSDGTRALASGPLGRPAHVSQAALGLSSCTRARGSNTGSRVRRIRPCRREGSGGSFARRRRHFAGAILSHGCQGNIEEIYTQ